jgi:toxin CptA
MKSIAPLSLPIKTSRRLLLLQSLAHIVAAAAVMSSAIQSGLAAFLLLLVGYSWLRVRCGSPVTGLILRGDGTIETIGSDGAVAGAVLHHHTLVLSYLVVLLYRQNDRLRALTLLGDNLSADDFRQLRLWLRWRGSTRPAESTA